MKLYSINAGYFKLDGGAMHGVVPKSMWQKANPADEHNMCSWAMRCMLVIHGERKILIDTCMGDKQNAKFFGHYYPHGEDSISRGLAALSLSEADITDVFLTHLHFDHCGGAIVRDGDALIPAFPNATFWSHAHHWEAAITPNEREKASFLKENILPMESSGKLKLLTLKDGEEWIPDIKIRITQGHTDSMMLPQINYHGRTVLYCADLIPSAAHVSMPWVMAYDMRPLDTLNEKRRILPEAAKENWVLFMEHDKDKECVTVTEQNGRIVVASTFPLRDLA